MEEKFQEDRIRDNSVEYNSLVSKTHDQCGQRSKRKYVMGVDEVAMISQRIQNDQQALTELLPEINAFDE